MTQMVSFPLSIIFAGIFLAVSVFRLILFLHMIQLEGYWTGRFSRWLFRHPRKMLAIQAVKDPKKKLVFTARATRLLITALLLLAAATYVLLQFSPLVSFLGAALICFFTPGVLIVANLLLYPLEMTIQHLYLQSAKRKLKKLKPKVIAITGSYGKTSTKDILTAVLSGRYQVLSTPGSFNTPMGICKVIRNELAAEHEILIIEMGARQRGDIWELCRLVKPEIGILTAIGPQHLEMFKSIDNIKRAKYELIEALPENGVAVFNQDDENCRDLADQTASQKVRRYGIQESFQKLHLKARDIFTSSRGITFVAQNSKGGAIPFQCQLLGKHNITNILAAATVALELGMSLGEVAQAVKGLEPSQHRLQLIRGAGGVLVVDDAFNANPVGAKMALEVLSEFPGGKKVLVTPGLVELGEKEFEENKKLGKQAAQVCDWIFLIGPKRTQAIYEGLKEAGFSGERIFVEKSLNDAVSKFPKILKAGDVVLFENDLPDTYNE
jgi:UDP-N-acetylmuramoyl-tripeptide--D-alanyl-D-alanine ligase